MERNIKTYLEFINESKEWLDVKDDYGTHNKLRVDNTLRIQVLDYIYQSGKEGRHYTDIVKFIIEDIKGEKYDYKLHRGHYSGLLTGRPGSWRGRGGTLVGILYKYCKQNNKKRWVLVNEDLISYFINNSLSDILSDIEIDALRSII